MKNPPTLADVRVATLLNKRVRYQRGDASLGFVTHDYERHKEKEVT
jgi:hypothetical protein